MDITWKKEYEVGDFEIDSEHQVFVRIIQKIQHAWENKREKGLIERLLMELFKYTEFHFCSEENSMLAVGYPDLSPHQHLHRDLLIELRNLLSVADDDDRNMPEIIAFLLHWFATHTATEDRKIAEYCRQRTIID